MSILRYCEKCGRTMDEGQFYGSNNLEKYPDAKLNQCKKCITLHVDNFDSDTYLWILQECDVPFVPDEWNKLLLKYAGNPEKITSMTILGRYLSKMKLKQYKDFRWKDNDFLQNVNNSKIEQTMKIQGYSAAEIAEAITKSSTEMPTEELPIPKYNDAPELPAAVGNAAAVAAMIKSKAQMAEAEAEDYFAQQSGANDDDFDADLTDEDRTYLRLKWGKTYKPEEWVKLEQLYNEMMSSYDIQGAGHIDTLKLCCKTSLKANQLIDIGDVEGFQKMSRAYDSLMKSGKFTAAQNKAENGEYVDSISELVELCERQGYIERFYVEEPNDKVDETIKDMQRYTKTLIEKETNLSALIDKAVQQNMKEDEADVEDTDEIIFDDDIDEVEKELFETDDIEEEIKEEEIAKAISTKGNKAKKKVINRKIEKEENTENDFDRFSDSIGEKKNKTKKKPAVKTEKEEISDEDFQRFSDFLSDTGEDDFASLLG